MWSRGGWVGGGAMDFLDLMGSLYSPVSEMDSANSLKNRIVSMLRSNRSCVGIPTVDAERPSDQLASVQRRVALAF